MRPEEAIELALAAHPTGTTHVIACLRDAGYHIIETPTVSVEDDPCTDDTGVADIVRIHVRGRFDDTLLRAEGAVGKRQLAAVGKPDGLVGWTRKRIIQEWMDELRGLLFPANAQEQILCLRVKGAT